MIKGSLSDLSVCITHHSYGTMKRCLSLIVLLYSSLSEPSSTGSTDLLRLISILLSVLVFAYLTYPITVHNELRFDECSWSMHLCMGRRDSVCPTSTKPNARSDTVPNPLAHSGPRPVHT